MEEAIHREIVQNNPILYIFIGNIDCSILQSIQRIQARRIGTKGIGYLCINKETKEENIRKEIERNHIKFMTKEYQYSGEIKVNYVLDVDDSFNLELPRIVKEIEHYLKYLYPTAITTDLFVLMDDAASVFSEERSYRNDVLDILGELQGDRLVYLLSNINSKYTFEPENKDNIICSIALIALIKDCVSLRPELVRHKFYNERYFREDSLRYGKRFMTIGYSNINKPVQVICKILVTKFLNFMDKDNRDTSVQINLPKFMPKDRLTLENLKSLPLSCSLPESEKKKLTNKEAMHLLYENRLDSFFDLNFSKNHTEEKEDENILHDLRSNEFYSLYYMTASNGTLMAELRKLQEQNHETMVRCEEEYDNWLARTGVQSYKKKLFKVIDEYPLMLAKEYLGVKLKLQHYRNEKRLLDKTLDEITALHNELIQMKTELDFFIEAKDEGIDTFDLNRDFYETKMVEYIESHYEEYYTIYQQMYHLLKKNEQAEYIKMVENYVDVNLAKITGKPIFDESYLMRWADRNKIYNIFLKTGGKNLHCETNLLMNKNSNYILEMEKVNLFFENSDTEMDILYHAGGFDKEDLYYAKLRDGTV